MLQTLTKQALAMTSLETKGSTLSLSRLGLQRLPSDFVERMEEKEITELDLSHNNLIPSSLPELSSKAAMSLVTVDFTGNRFTELPKGLMHLTRLKTLTLKHNLLKSLPDSFSDLKDLRELNLSGNQLEQFPLPILRLSNLEFLHLGGNRLQHVPSDINRLKE